jgi:hypothetical protein
MIDAEETGSSEISHRNVDISWVYEIQDGRQSTSASPKVLVVTYKVMHYAVDHLAAISSDSLNQPTFHLLTACLLRNSHCLLKFKSAYLECVFYLI